MPSPPPCRTRSGTGGAPGCAGAGARLGALALALVIATGLGSQALPPAETGAHPYAAQPTVDYRLPVDDVVLRRFESPERRWSPGHRGVDIAAAVGSAVVAPADGVVGFSGWVVDRGVIAIDHPDGVRTSLEPLSGLLPRGTRVRAGAVVGVIAEGGAHCAPADCLHWGVRRGQTYLDPLALLPGAGPVVLLATAVERGDDGGCPVAQRRSLSSARYPATSSAAAASPRCASGRCATR